MLGFQFHLIDVVKAWKLLQDALEERGLLNGIFQRLSPRHVLEIVEYHVSRVLVLLAKVILDKLFDQLSVSSQEMAPKVLVLHYQQGDVICSEQLDSNAADSVLRLLGLLRLHDFKVGSEAYSELLLEPEGLEHFEVEVMLGLLSARQIEVVALEC